MTQPKEIPLSTRLWLDKHWFDWGGILPDHQIRERVKIEPFADYGDCPPGAVSFGLGHYGYDMRVDRKYKIFSPVFNCLVDPKAFDPRSFVDFEGDYCIIPPNSFALGVSVECFEIPRDMLALVLGKSTYARCGIVCNVTPLEPEWHGKVTIEISNTTPLPAKIYSGEGIAQVLFLKCPQDIECLVSYADKKGRYQGQTDLTLPFVKEVSS